MAQTITVTARKLFALGELVTSGKLNLAQFITLELTGTVDTTEITNDGVTAAKAAFGAWFYCTAATASNVITLTATGHTLSDSTLAAGLLVAFKADATTTGTVDIKIGATAKNLYRAVGTELRNGDIRSGQMCVCEYDGTQWQLVTAAAYDHLITGQDAGSSDAYAVAMTPTVRAYADITGIPVVFKANTVNTGACTLNLDSLGAIAIKKEKDQDPATGDIKAGQWVLVVYDGTNFQMLSPVTKPAQPVMASSRSLIIQPNVTNPTYQVDVDAEEIILTSAADISAPTQSDNTYRALNVNLTIDISLAPAANGRDSGSESNDWWYVWLCYESSSDTVAGLLSLSNTAPAKPSGFAWDYSALVGVIRNSDAANEGASAGNIVPFYQTDRQVYVNDAANNYSIDVLDATDGPGKGSPEIYTALAGADLTLFGKLVPPIARRVRGQMGVSTAGAAAAAYGIGVAGNAAGVGECCFKAEITDATEISEFIQTCPFEVPLPTAQTLYWKTTDTGTNNVYRLSVSGYTI